MYELSLTEHAMMSSDQRSSLWHPTNLLALHPIPALPPAFCNFPGGPIQFQKISSISRRDIKFQSISSISRSCRHLVLSNSGGLHGAITSCSTATKLHPNTSTLLTSNHSSTCTMIGRRHTHMTSLMTSMKFKCKSEHELFYTSVKAFIFCMQSVCWYVNANFRTFFMSHPV